MIEEDRLVSAEKINHDLKQDGAIRPKTFTEYIGQAEAKEQMHISITAALARNDCLDHTLILGPPGLGKTTMANIIAHEMGVQITSTSGPVIDRKGDLVALLTQMERGDVLFIDEIHRLNSTIEEILYPAMEDFQVDITIGEGPAARSIKYDLNPFTLVGATTRTGLLTSPLRDRFGIVQRLDFYDVKDLAIIIERSSKLLSVSCNKKGAVEIARRSRGTPRIANRLLRRVRDFAEVRKSGKVDALVADEALNMLNVDANGFDTMDRRILMSLIDKFDGGPVGIDSIAAAIGEERDAIEEVYEPFLIQQGFVMRTARGRVATKTAYRYFGIERLLESDTVLEDIFQEEEDK